MKKFIKVTVCVEKSDTHQTRHINPDHIVDVVTHPETGDHAGIRLVTGEIVAVIESVQEVMDQINPPPEVDKVGVH